MHPLPSCLSVQRRGRQKIISVDASVRSEEHTSELQSHVNLVCRLLLETTRHHPRTTLFPYTTLFRSTELVKDYTIVIVTHNMQQAARVSHFTGFFLTGKLVEYAPTTELFERPKKRETEDYISGRFG